MLAAVLLLVVAVIVATNLGKDPGSPGTDGTETPTTRSGPGRAAVLRGLNATAFDPQTDGEENDADAPNVVDGDQSTTWSTSTYNDQLGPPPGLKTGVGVTLSLGAERDLDQVVLSFVGAPTAVSVYVTAQAPTSVDDLEPAASGTADGPRLSLDLDGASGSFVVVWLTSLPPTDDGRFRGTLAEVVVRGG